MEGTKMFSGRWPLVGAKDDTIRAFLDQQFKEAIRWGESEVLGFPSMSPHPFGLDILQQGFMLHANNIMTLTRSRGEKGFTGFQNIERDLINMVGNLLGAKQVDGYVTSGGTEANMMGLWVGREKLRHTVVDPSDNRVAVLASSASHYSLRKACNILDLGEGTWTPCAKPCLDPIGNKPIKHVFHPSDNGGGLHFIKCDESGRIDVVELERRICHLRKHYGIRRFLIFLNEGTTLTGAMDNVQSVGSLVSCLRNDIPQKWDFYIHVDAAYGGFVYPFLRETQDMDWGFRVPQVDSMTVDPYKMGQCPLAEGIFLCRRSEQGDGPQRYIERSAHYVDGAQDDTLIGSRAGAFAAACWAVFQREGSSGFAGMHSASLLQRDYLADRLAKLSLQTQCHLNMVSFYFPQDLDSAAWRQMANLVTDYRLMWDWFSRDPEDPEDHPRKIVKFNITRDVKREWIDNFISDLEKIF
jgi:tyrosine decarboxylase/aspartate 1-decarboxylase